jgi:hypothetical protein
MKHIMGVPRTSPVMQVPIRDLYRLQELNSIVSRNRGQTPVGAPGRDAIPEYVELLDRLFSDYAIPQGHLEKVTGKKSPLTYSRYLAYHGLRPSPPSQGGYSGVPTPPRPRVRVMGGLCKNGHLLTPETAYWNNASLRCKTCKAAARKRRAPNRKPNQMSDRTAELINSLRDAALESLRRPVSPSAADALDEFADFIERGVGITMVGLYEKTWVWQESVARHARERAAGYRGLGEEVAHD